jgi:hypothetical protein
MRDSFIDSQLILNLILKSNVAKAFIVLHEKL